MQKSVVLKLWKRRNQSAHESKNDANVPLCLFCNQKAKAGKKGNSKSAHELIPVRTMQCQESVLWFCTQPNIWDRASWTVCLVLQLLTSSSRSVIKLSLATKSQSTVSFALLFQRLVTIAETNPKDVPLGIWVRANKCTNITVWDIRAPKASKEAYIGGLPLVTHWAAKRAVATESPLCFGWWQSSALFDVGQSCHLQPSIAKLRRLCHS